MFHTSLGDSHLCFECAVLQEPSSQMSDSDPERWADDWRISHPPNAESDKGHFVQSEVWKSNKMIMSRRHLSPNPHADTSTFTPLFATFPLEDDTR